MSLLRSADRNFAAGLEAFCRQAAPPPELVRSVSSILAAVRAEGDRAVARFALKFDGARLRPRDFPVRESELARAWRGLPVGQRKALGGAHRNVADFNRRGLPRDWMARTPQGARAGEKFDPIRRVGLYVPGGHAPLVSTVLMTATLARLAGCPEIAAFTPPGRDGRVAPAILAALRLCGVREVYRIGGVQAVGAMAYGTASIPAVDKIFGPGNAYVCEAKRQVFGAVGVDALPGPSELMIIADGSVPPDFAAADIHAQAEHGSGYERIVIAGTLDALLPIAAASSVRLDTEPRRDVIRAVLNNGFLSVVVDHLRETAAVANRIAPEHLQLLVRKSAVPGLLRSITTAGAIMIGGCTPTALGDFTAGPSHVLPTGGTGRFSSGLRVHDFIRRTSVLRYGAASLKRAAPIVAAFAEMEGLDAHGESVRVRNP